MSYEVNYWETNGKSDECIRTVRIGRVSEIIEEGLVINRPNKTSVITLDRTDRQSVHYKILWQSANYVDLNER